MHYFLLYNQKIMLWPWNNTRCGRALQPCTACGQLKHGSQASDAPGDQQQAVLMQYLLGIPHPHWWNKGRQKGELRPMLQGLPGTHSHPVKPHTATDQYHWEPVLPHTRELLLELHSSNTCAGICRHTISDL